MSGTTVTVAVGELCLDALEREGESGSEGLSRPLSQAIRYYLADRDAGRTAWLYPKFLRDAEPAPAGEVSLAIDDASWREFLLEADRQDVSPDQLVQHAVLYMAADLDSGRLTERILESLEE